MKGEAAFAFCQCVINCHKSVSRLNLPMFRVAVKCVLDFNQNEAYYHILFYYFLCGFVTSRRHVYSLRTIRVNMFTSMYTNTVRKILFHLNSAFFLLPSKCQQKFFNFSRRLRAWVCVKLKCSSTITSIKLIQFFQLKTINQMKFTKNVCQICDTNNVSLDDNLQKIYGLTWIFIVFDVDRVIIFIDLSGMYILRNYTSISC